MSLAATSLLQLRGNQIGLYGVSSGCEPVGQFILKDATVQPHLGDLPGFPGLLRAHAHGASP